MSSRVFIGSLRAEVVDGIRFRSIKLEINFEIILAETLWKLIMPC